MDRVNFIVEEVFKNTEPSKKNEILKKTILKMSLENYYKKMPEQKSDNTQIKE